MFLKLLHKLLDLIDIVIQKDYYSCIKSSQPKFDKFQYINIGLWNKKDELKFYKQTNDNYVSQSLVENMFGQNMI